MVVETLERLIQKKEELLMHKEENLVKIKEIDKKIAECITICNQCSSMEALKNHQIQQYRGLQEYKEEHSNTALGLLNIFQGNFSYAKRKIKQLEREMKSIGILRYSSQEEIRELEFNKKQLINKNISIDNQIFIIDEQINKEENRKVYKKENK